MATAVIMPALGESVTEGTVTTWLKSVGDTVALDEPRAGTRKRSRAHLFRSHRSTCFGSRSGCLVASRRNRGTYAGIG